MRVLLDTCVLAELRDPRGHRAVKTTITRVSPDNLFLSVLVVGEIAKAISLLADGHKKRALGHWLAAMESQFADRILPIDTETAHLWGELSVRCRGAGLTLPVVDGLLAATALRHGLHLVTRHTSNLAATGVLILDPWAETTDDGRTE